MKRMLEVRDIHAVTLGGSLVVGDVRVRVNLSALARALGPKAIGKRGHRVALAGGAVVVEAFNIRPVVAGTISPDVDLQSQGEPQSESGAVT